MDEIRLGQITALEMAIAWTLAACTTRTRMTPSLQIEILKNFLEPQIADAAQSKGMEATKVESMLTAFKNTLESIAKNCAEFDPLVMKLDP